MKVYRETLYGIMESKGVKPTELSKKLGYVPTYISSLFPKTGKGWTELSKLQTIGISTLIGCTELELAAIPSKARADAPAAPVVPAEPAKDYSAELSALMDQMTAGFKMLHSDLQALIAVMEKYWKPSEPKYEVKEREQP